MTLKPPMTDPTTTTIPTIARLATTMSPTLLPRTTADATTAIPTGSFLMTTEINSEMKPIIT